MRRRPLSGRREPIFSPFKGSSARAPKKTGRIRKTPQFPWLASIIPAMVWMVVCAKRSALVGFFSVSWFSFAYLAWIPLSLLTNRMSYIFYFYPAVGAVCLGLAWGLWTLVARARREETVGRRRLLVGLAAFYLAFHAAVLVLLTPLFSFWASLQMAVPPA